jgi:hypothetical protein
MQFSNAKTQEPRPSEGVIFVSGIMFAAIKRENPGAGAFRGVFSLVQIRWM